MSGGLGSGSRGTAPHQGSRGEATQNDERNLAGTGRATAGCCSTRGVLGQRTLPLRPPPDPPRPLSINPCRYESETYKTEPFDVVIDCVGWRDEWKLAGRTGALKSGWNGGRYISVASSDNPQIRTVWQVMMITILCGCCCCFCCY